MSDTFNPYAPPAETGAQAEPNAVASNATAIPRVFGILSIVFSSVVFLLIGFGALIGYIAAQAKEKRVAEVSAPAKAKGPVAIAAEVQGESAEAPKAAKRPARPQPLQEAAGVIIGLAWLVGTPLLLFFGIGQLRYKRWARFATLGWGGLVVLAIVASIGLGVAGGEVGAETIPLVFMSVSSAVYPILLLIFFTRPRVAAAMVR